MNCNTTHYRANSSSVPGDPTPIEAHAGRSIRVSEKTIQRLEELRQRVGKESPDAVLEDALDAYERLRLPDEVAAYQRLTPRLREVLRLIAEGRSTKEIAYKLKLSAKTVEFHRGQLMKKLDIQGVANLVRFAVRVGVVAP